MKIYCQFCVKRRHLLLKMICDKNKIWYERDSAEYMATCNADILSDPHEKMWSHLHIKLNQTIENKRNGSFHGNINVYSIVTEWKAWLKEMSAIKQYFIIYFAFWFSFPIKSVNT